MQLKNDFVIERLKKQYHDAICDVQQDFGELSLTIYKEYITQVCQFLKENPDLNFNFLMDLSCVDYWGREGSSRFEVVYHLYSLTNKIRIRLKVLVNESDTEIDSTVSIWDAANWYEREVWDMFGVRFRGHPDLKRILMYEGFEGHPLRKDYPYKKRQPLVGPVN